MVEVVMARCDDVFAPPAFDPPLGIDLPARVIEHRVNGHNHQ